MLVNIQQQLNGTVHRMFIAGSDIYQNRNTIRHSAFLLFQDLIFITY